MLFFSWPHALSLEELAKELEEESAGGLGSLSDIIFCFFFHIGKKALPDFIVLENPTFGRCENVTERDLREKTSRQPKIL